jgi:hypothetical protein
MSSNNFLTELYKDIINCKKINTDTKTFIQTRRLVICVDCPNQIGQTTIGTCFLIKGNTILGFRSYYDIAENIRSNYNENGHMTHYDNTRILPLQQMYLYNTSITVYNAKISDMTKVPNNLSMKLIEGIGNEIEIHGTDSKETTEIIDTLVKCGFVIYV